MKIVVMCGGLSMERNVSLSSGTLICKALRALGHKAVLVDMFYGLEDYDVAPAELFENLPPIQDKRVEEAEPDLEAVKASRKWQSPSMIGQGVLEICQLADVVFLGLHGACGEDGRIQAALDLLGVPYTGSGYLGSALAMDKHMTKLLVKPVLEKIGVHTPEWKSVNYTEQDIDRIIAETALPVVVKPVDSGSSIGVTIPRTPDEMRFALQDNLKLGRVMIEQYIQGREIDIGVLEGRALPSIEIIPKVGFYDYKNKYQAGAATEICPSEIDPAIEAKLGEAVLAVFDTLGLKDYSRADFMVDAKGEIYFIEINTLPGMTPTSLMPQEAAAVGIDYESLCQKLVDLALEGKK